MARYHETIERRRKGGTVKRVMALVNMLAQQASDGKSVTDGEANDPQVIAREIAMEIPRLVNDGIVCVPRACQSTVRLTIVQGLCKDLPVKVGLETRQATNSAGEAIPGKTYQALTVTHTGSGPHCIGS